MKGFMQRWIYEGGSSGKLERATDGLCWMENVERVVEKEQKKSFCVWRKSRCRRQKEEIFRERV